MERSTCRPPRAGWPTERWTKVRPCFEHDDGSLPTVEISSLTPDEVGRLYSFLRGCSKSTSVDPKFWDSVEEREVPIDDVPNAGSLVALRRAEPFHFNVDCIGIHGAAIPCLGVHVFQETIALDYRMGDDWNAENVYAYFKLLKSMVSRTRHGVLGLDSEAPPEPEVFMAAWRQVLQETSDELATIMESVDAPSAAAVDEALARLESMDASDVDVRYAIGYVLYHHPDRVRRSDLIERTRRALEAVLEAYPDHFGAHLYLGHNRYDEGAFADARVHFVAARDLAPTDFIGMKAYELVACCSLHLGDSATAIADLEAFAVAVEAASGEVAIAPMGLERVLEGRAWMEKASPDLVAKLGSLCSRIDRAGGTRGWLTRSLEEALRLVPTVPER